jgi:hypothetical protein
LENEGRNEGNEGERLEREWMIVLKYYFRVVWVVMMMMQTDATFVLANAFRMCRDVQSYSLGGMGCSNGVVGMSLVRDLLQVGRSGSDEAPSIGMWAFLKESILEFR